MAYYNYVNRREFKCRRHDVFHKQRGNWRLQLKTLLSYKVTSQYYEYMTNQSLFLSVIGGEYTRCRRDLGRQMLTQASIKKLFWDKCFDRIVSSKMDHLVLYSCSNDKLRCVFKTGFILGKFIYQQETLRSTLYEFTIQR